MLRHVVLRLPPGLVRAIGRAQFRSPLIARAARLAASNLTTTGTIRHGAGAGLRFDATGGYPGYLLGTSEPEEQAFVAANLAPGAVFYDIGANIGFYSTIAARLVGASGCVYAFEPYPKSSAGALRNARLNGFTNVTVVTAAVSDTNGHMMLRLSDHAAQHRLAEGTGVPVEVVTIDQWIRRENARPPTLVMIDVEGAELQALEGMRATLLEHRPVVCCEVHWLGQAFVDYCHDQLASMGYSMTNLNGGPIPIAPSRWHAVLSPSD